MISLLQYLQSLSLGQISSRQSHLTQVSAASDLRAARNGRINFELDRTMHTSWCLQHLNYQWATPWPIARPRSRDVWSMWWQSVLPLRPVKRWACRVGIWVQWITADTVVFWLSVSPVASWSFLMHDRFFVIPDSKSLGLGVVRGFLVGTENRTGTLEPWNTCCWGCKARLICRINKHGESPNSHGLSRLMRCEHRPGRKVAVGSGTTGERRRTGCLDSSTNRRRMID